MDKHNSLVVTKIAVVALFAAIVFPIASFVRDTFYLNKWIALLVAILLTVGLMWLLSSILLIWVEFFIRSKASETKK